jgi:hypothetical protein
MSSPPRSERTSGTSTLARARRSINATVPSDAGSFEVVATEVDPVVLSGTPREDAVEAPGDNVVYRIAERDGARVIDVSPRVELGADDPTLDVLVEFIGAVPERVTLTDRDTLFIIASGAHDIIVSGAHDTAGPFRISSTPVVPLTPGEPNEGMLVGDESASYFEIPGDGERGVLLTSPNVDLDLEMQFLVDGEEQRVINDSADREIGFTDGTGEQTVVRVQRSERSESSGRDFRIEVSDPLEQLQRDRVVEKAGGLTVFEISNSEGELSEFAVEPVADEDAGVRAPEDGSDQREDGLVLDVFDARGLRAELSVIARHDGGSSLILLPDDTGPFRVVVSSPSAVDEAFSARYEALENPEPGGAPVAASGSRPFLVQVNEGEQVEFTAQVVPESGPSLTLAPSSPEGESAQTSESFIPGDSVGLILGCDSTAAGTRRWTVDVNVLDLPDQTSDYEVMVRANPVDDTGIDWCGARDSESVLIGPTYVGLLTRSGAAPAQAYCVVRAWYEEVGADGEIELFSKWITAARAEPDSQQEILDEIGDEMDPFLRNACDLSEFAIQGGLDRVNALVQGVSTSLT